MPQADLGRLGDATMRGSGRAPVQGSRDADIGLSLQRQHLFVDYLRRIVEDRVVAEIAARDVAGPGVTSRAIADATARAAANSREPSIRPAEMVAFATSLLDGEREAALAILARLQRGGATPETLCLDLLSSAARHFGSLWERDEASIVAVTAATSALHEILRALGLDQPPAALTDHPPPSAILATVPGEQHSFGLTMLTAFFRRAGWVVRNPAIATAGDAGRSVATRPFDVAGFSLGAEAHLDRLRSCIEQVRRRSSNRHIVVMVGGPIFLAAPELIRAVGADATAPDAPRAIEIAQRLCRARRVPAAGTVPARA